MKEVLRAAVLIVILCSASTFRANAQSGTGANTEAKQSSPSPSVVEDYIIGVNDLLEVSVWGEPQFDLKVAVRPDGKIGVKLLNDVQAGGLTTNQLIERITQGLKPYVPEARVTVIVLEIRSQMVHITGNGVAKGGAYPLVGPLNVFELLSRAGLTEFAKKNEIKIIRPDGNTKFTTFPFNYETFANGKYLQNIVLRNGDMVIVP